MADLGTIKCYSFLGMTSSTLTSTAVPSVRSDVLASDLKLDDVNVIQYDPTEVVRSPVDVQLPTSTGSGSGVAVKQYWG